MITYAGSIDDGHELIQFFRREVDHIRALKTVWISREKTIVKDVNGEGIEFPGLTFGMPNLELLLRELGVIFTPATLHNPNATPNGIKEYVLSARWTWGHDRVM